MRIHSYGKIVTSNMNDTIINHKQAYLQQRVRPTSLNITSSVLNDTNGANRSPVHHVARKTVILTMKTPIRQNAKQLVETPATKREVVQNPQK
jgi:hypothetical protein